MKDDFNKLLVERERNMSSDKFHFYRHKKFNGLNDDVAAGREGMKRRYIISGNPKIFSENLSPLIGWIRTCVGKKWDRCYSELSQKFDKRGVINNHILEHLWQYLERHAFLADDGKTVMVYLNYSFNGKTSFSGKAIPIWETSHEFYICPKDGIVKINSRRLTYRQRRAVRVEKEQEERNKIRRVINDDEVLYFIEGNWFHFDLLPDPKVSFEYVKPQGQIEFEVSNRHSRLKIKKTWEELNQAEREHFGRRQVVSKATFDELFQEAAYNADIRAYNLLSVSRKSKYTVVPGKYHANKKSASKKQLKAAGLY